MNGKVFMVGYFLVTRGDYEELRSIGMYVDFGARKLYE